MTKARQEEDIKIEEEKNLSPSLNPGQAAHIQ